MAERVCFDLDLLFERAGEGYRVRVLRSPAGEGQTVWFKRPFGDLELENLLLKIGGRSWARTRRVDTAPVAAAKQLGGRLFQSVFTGPVGECLRRSTDRVHDDGATLRIRLRLSDCLELATMPWEFLYDKDNDWFVALSDATPVVRYMQMPIRVRPVRMTLPLRILVIRSEPTDCPGLDLAAEWAQVKASLSDLSEAGAVTVTDLAVPTLAELRRALMREQFHVLHYMGHGSFTEQDGGSLLFTDDAGHSKPVTGADLSVMIRDHTSLRLAVLNACDAGRTDPGDPFGGTADTLVRHGVPAVIAMQFEVTDTAAIEFAPALYGALAAGRPVDSAVAEARKAIYAVSALEWATPVLHLRADDARLFEIGQFAPAFDPAEAASHYGRGSVLHKQGRFPEAEAAFREAIRLAPEMVIAHSYLGAALNGQKRFQEAETAYREAVRLDSADSGALLGLAVVLFMQSRYEDADTVWRDAVARYPDRRDLRRLYINFLDMHQPPAMVAGACRDAIRAFPFDFEWHETLGDALSSLKNYEQAEAEYLEALRLGAPAAGLRRKLANLLYSQGE